MNERPSPVVVGYDFSATGQSAVRRAVTLAMGTPRHVLHVICVIDPSRPVAGIPSDTGVDYVYAERVQEALAVEMRKELEQVGCSQRVQFFVHARIGKAAHEVLRLAAEVGADLIVVGSHGHTGLERALLGSTSEKIVREAGCSVEIARPKQYPEVELLDVVDVEPSSNGEHPYVPPHRYEYEDRALVRSNDFPLGGGTY